MRKVFIPQLPTRYDKATDSRIPSIDLNPAAEYGQLVPMVTQPLPTPEALDTIKLLSAEIGPDDYILAVGDVALLAAAVAFAMIQTGRATVLRWDRVKQSYSTVEVEI